MPDFVHVGSEGLDSSGQISADATTNPAGIAQRCLKALGISEAEDTVVKEVNAQRAAGVLQRDGGVSLHVGGVSTGVSEPVIVMR